MRAAKVQASLRIRAVSPEPSLLAHTSSESRGTFRQKARSLAPLNGWACAVEICHDRMLEDTNSLDGAHLWINFRIPTVILFHFLRKNVVGGKNKNKIVWMLFYFYLDFGKNIVGSPENQNITKFWPNVITFQLTDWFCTLKTVLSHTFMPENDEPAHEIMVLIT